jgi:hypothetical protein
MSETLNITRPDGRKVAIVVIPATRSTPPREAGRERSGVRVSGGVAPRTGNVAGAIPGHGSIRPEAAVAAASPPRLRPLPHGRGCGAARGPTVCGQLRGVDRQLPRRRIVGASGSHCSTHRPRRHRRRACEERRRLMGWRATVADQRQRAEQAERERDDLRKGYATWSAEIHQMREERDEARAKVERLRSALGDLTAQTYVAHHANPTTPALAACRMAPSSFPASVARSTRPAPPWRTPSEDGMRKMKFHFVV